MSEDTHRGSNAAKETRQEPIVISCDTLTISATSDDRDPLPVLSEVSLVLEPGTTHAVVGAEGSGKTTLGLALLGSIADGLAHTGGSVRICGTDPFALDRDRARTFHARNTAWLGSYADRAFALTATVRELLSNAMTARSATGAAAVDEWSLFAALAAVGMNNPAVLDRVAAELHAVDRRRVALAIALARAATEYPKLIVLDEPTAGLAGAGEAAMLGVLSGVQRVTGAAILVLTRSFDVARACAMSVSVLESGRIVRGARSAAEPVAAGVGAASAAGPAAGAAVAGAAATSAVIELRGFAVLRADGVPETTPVSLAVCAAEGLAVTEQQGTGQQGTGQGRFARALCGEIRQSSALRIGGELLLNGTALAPRVTHRLPEERRAIQLVSSDPVAGMTQSHTIRTQLRRAVRRAQPDATPRAVATRVAELLRFVQLDSGVLAMRPYELRAEAAQRIAIARALAHEPLVLVCDEPGAVLDEAGRRGVLALLREARNVYGIALIVMTQSAEVARLTCDSELRLLGGGQRELRSTLAA